MSYYLAIDIGGTYMKYATIDEQGLLSNHHQVHTPFNENHAIVKQVEKIVTEMCKQFTIDGIGISTAGIVDQVQGEIIYAGPTIYAYQGTNFKKALAFTHLPIHVENDVNAALLGERWKGAGQHGNHLYCITLGTGIGGAYYHNGLMGGANAQANSVGYMLYHPQTETNFEQRASTSALNQAIKTQLGKEWTAQQVFQQAREGDHDCLEIISNWTKEVAAGLSQIILLIDPEQIIIGGGISQQGDFLLDMIKKHIEGFLPSNLMKTKLSVATLYNDAALYGAVYPFYQ